MSARQLGWGRCHWCGTDRLCRGVLYGHVALAICVVCYQLGVEHVADLWAPRLA